MSNGVLRVQWPVPGIRLSDIDDQQMNEQCMVHTRIFAMHDDKTSPRRIPIMSVPSLDSE